MMAKNRLSNSQFTSQIKHAIRNRNIGFKHKFKAISMIKARQKKNWKLFIDHALLRLKFLESVLEPKFFSLYLHVRC